MTASLVYQIPCRYVEQFMSYRDLKSWKSDTYVHRHAHTRTYPSGNLQHARYWVPLATFRRQLKITFLDVLDYSEYSNTNIAIFFYVDIASSVRKLNFLCHFSGNYIFTWSSPRILELADAIRSIIYRTT